jgi:hypothetical protein
MFYGEHRKNKRQGDSQTTPERITKQMNNKLSKT